MARGKRHSAAVTASVIAAALAAGAAASETETGIRPGVGIGSVRLGMTETRVRAVLGPPSYVVRRERRGFGSRYIEFGWNQAAWTVALQGRDGHLRVVKVATTLRTQRVRRVGAGSLLRAVVTAFPGTRCVDKWLTHRAPNTIVPSSFHGRWLIVGEARRSHTVFVVGYSFDSTNNAATPPPGQVAEVIVQEPAPTPRVISTSCRSGWRRDDPAARPGRYGPP
jgi:hypothetical protein